MFTSEDRKRIEDNLIGKKLDDAIHLAQTHSLNMVRPNEFSTMQYDPDRCRPKVDDQNTIIGIEWG